MLLPCFLLYPRSQVPISPFFGFNDTFFLILRPKNQPAGIYSREIPVEALGTIACPSISPDTTPYNLFHLFYKFPPTPLYLSTFTLILRTS